MKTKIESPFVADGWAYLTSVEKEKEYRGHKYKVTEYTYICEKTGEPFCDGEALDATLYQTWNQYRNEMGIPYPSEFQNLRELCGLPRSTMSRLVGFGENQWAEFEKNEMPSVSIGRYIRTLIDSSEALSDLIKNSDVLSCSQKENALQSIKDKGKESYQHGVCYDCRPGLINGCCPQSISKLKNMILYFLNERGGEGKTALNKLMFYADFGMYAKYSRGISGLSYSALPFGAVPNRFKIIYNVFDEIEEIEKGERTLLIAKANCDTSVFSREELEMLHSVTSRFKGMNASQLSDICHQEKAWLRYKDNPHQSIPYTEAYTLKALQG